VQPPGSTASAMVKLTLGVLVLLGVLYVTLPIWEAPVDQLANTIAMYFGLEA
jgi:hypothetical protein